MNTNSISHDLAKNVVKALTEIYITSKNSENGLGLVGDVLYGIYKVVLISDGQISNTILDFKNQVDFIDWLKKQTDESLSLLIDKNESLKIGLKISDLIQAVKAYELKATGQLPGPYKILDQRGDSYYSVPPIHYSCVEKDLEVFNEALKRSTKVERLEAVANGNNALSAACESGFLYGAEALMESDGLCCGANSYCKCLSLAIKSGSTDIVKLFKSSVKDEVTFLKMQPPTSYYSYPERTTMDSLGLPPLKSSAYLNEALKSEYSDLTSFQIIRFIEASPGVNLNQVDIDGFTPLLRYLATHSVDLMVVEKFLEFGADLNILVGKNKSALDLLAGNPSIASRSLKDVRRLVYKSGIRSKNKSFFKRLWINFLS